MNLQRKPQSLHPTDFIHQPCIYEPLDSQLIILGSCTLLYYTIDKLFILFGKLGRDRVPYMVDSYHLLFWCMLGNVFFVGPNNFFLNFSYGICIIGLNELIYSFGHTANKVIFTKMLNIEGSERFYHIPHSMLQQIHTLLETTCPQKLLECHRIHFQSINLSYRIGFPLMKSQAEKGTGYCHMILPCIFTEILQRGKSAMQLLYFIHNDEGLAGFYINTSNGSDGEKDAIYIII